MIKSEKETPKHIQILIDMFSTNDYDDQIEENFAHIAKVNKYIGGIRFYFNIYSNSFVNSPSKGFTFLRTIIPETSNGVYKADYVKPYIKEALEKYYLELLSDNFNINSYFSNGMATYLDLPVCDAIRIVTKNISEINPVILTLIDESIEINNLVYDYDVVLTSSNLNMLSKVLDIDEFMYSIDNLIDNISKKYFKEPELDQFESYVNLLIYNNDILKSEEVLDLFNNINLYDFEHFDRILSILSNIDSSLLLKYETHNNLNLRHKLISPNVYLYPYKGQYYYDIISAISVSMSFEKRLNIYISESFINLVKSFQNASYELLEKCSGNVYSTSSRYGVSIENLNTDLLNKFEFDEYEFDDSVLFYKIQKRA